MNSVDSKRANCFSTTEAIEVTIAPNAGACFGVVRAIKLGLQASKKSETGKEKVYSLGPLIHNPKVVDELEGRGVETVEDPNVIREGTAVLRSHGVKKEIEKELKSRGVKLVDATCPLVKKPQRIAQSLGEKGAFLVLVGDENHPEVKGVLSYFGRPDYLVTYCAQDVQKIPTVGTKIGVIAQTTIEAKVLDAVVAECRSRFSDVTVFNTICDATSIRQTEAKALAQSADVVIVVGGRNSSNTKKLEKICKDHQSHTYLIEELHEIDPKWFLGKRKIGVTGGASTPMEYVDQVGNYIAGLFTTSHLLAQET